MQKDETKEILDKLEKLCYDDYCLEFSVDYIERKEEKLLLDYITNLQEEVKFTEDYKDAYETTMIANKMLEEKYIVYKSRIDKAVEYIENDLKSFLYSIEYKTLLNILNGDK